MCDPTVFHPDAVSEETTATYAAWREATASLRATLPPQTAQAYRDAMVELIARFSGGQTYRSPQARELTTPGGVRLRVIEADEPAGVYLHIHGGGWTIGAADQQDALLEQLVAATSHTVVSVEYRLAPEAPYPAPLDDCEDAARWLADHAEAEFGTTRLTIGGDSAGANLTLATLLRLRARPARLPFVAGNLLYGLYDLTMTPSQRIGGGAVITPELAAWFADQYVPDSARRSDPEVSPLYAELRGLPPLLLTVGTIDTLLDDTLFLYARLIAANARVGIQILPGGDHGFDQMPFAIAQQANKRIAEFLAER